MKLQNSNTPKFIKRPVSIIFFCLIYFILILLIKNAHIFNSSTDQLLFHREFELFNRKYPTMTVVDKQQKSYSMFFVETNSAKIEFTTKQICALESAARNNPNATVHVYSIRPVFNAKILPVLSTYSNLKLNEFVPDQVFNNTPLSKWWSSKIVLRSQFVHAHISDAAR